MDPTRFDALARSFAAGTRRRLLAAMAATALGAGLLAFDGDEAGADHPRDRVRRRTAQHHGKQRNGRRRTSDAKRNDHQGDNVGVPRAASSGSLLGGQVCRSDTQCRSGTCAGVASPTGGICTCSEGPNPVPCHISSTLLYCDHDNLCKLSKSAGESCGENKQCKSQECRNGRCTCSRATDCRDARQTCNENHECVFTRRPPGDACQVNGECLSTECRNGVCTCSASAHCTDPLQTCNQAHECVFAGRFGGEACQANGNCLSHDCRNGLCTCTDRVGCADGSKVCNTGQCVTPQLGGTICHSDGECKTGVCRGLLPGHPGICSCSNDMSVPCATPGVRCVLESRTAHGRCHAPSSGGVQCLDGSFCLSNTCPEGRCGCSDGPNGIPCRNKAERCLNGRCVVAKLGGAPCEADRECQSNQCLDIGLCGCTAGPNPVGCLDPQNPCRPVACENGVCRRRNLADGAACPADTDNPCIANVCHAGACTHRAKPDGAACGNTDDPCAISVCRSGTCTHSVRPDGAPCGDTDNPCVIDVCRSGACTHSVKPDGATCDRTGRCRQGTCQIPPRSSAVPTRRGGARSRSATSANETPSAATR